MSVKKFLTVWVMVITAVIPVLSKDKDADALCQEVVEAVTADYKEWNKAGWTGKLSTDMLPVSATMKVYMERGKLTMISLRAPLFGEVARIEVDADSILMVNKMKKRYYSKSLKEYSAVAPDLNEDLQALLLGRMFVIGSGELNKECASQVVVFPDNDSGTFMIVPEVPDYLPDVLYGFGTNADAKMAAFVCAYGRADKTGNANDPLDPELQYEPEIQAQAEITYRGNRATADLQLLFKGRSFNATLTADGVECGAKGFDRINVKGYTKTGLSQILKF